MVYLVYLLFSAIFAPRNAGGINSGLLAYSRSIDIIAMVLLLILFYWAYKTALTTNEKQNVLGFTIQWTHDFFNDPASLIETFIFTVVFFLLVYIFHVPMSPDVKPVVVHLVEHKIWIFYACFAIIFFFKYALGIPIVDILLNNSVTQYFENLPPYGTPASSSSAPASSGFFTSIGNAFKSIFNGSTTSPVPSTNGSPLATNASPPPPPIPTTISFAPTAQINNIMPTTNSASSNCTTTGSSPAPNKQVFNVANNKYTYSEAQAVCNAYDADLATYDQIEQSYLNGGEWCNYGWSADQMAFFPTQKSTWNNLQQDPSMKNACGRPGINGGFMGNPNIRFGANCYGVKPPAPPGWQPDQYPINPSNTIVTGPKEDPILAKLRKNAKLNGFNNSEWSRYN